MKRVPSALTRLAGRAVNNRIKSAEDIRALEIPICLKEELRKHYIEDRLHCAEEIDFAEDFVREASDARFDEPFADVGADRYLLYRNWKWRYGVPNFAWEVNHVVHCYYQFGCLFDNGRYIEEEERYCADCARGPSYIRSVSTHIREVAISEVVRSGYLIDEIFDVSNH